MGLTEWWRRAIGTPVTEAAKPTPPGPAKVNRAGFEFGIPPSGLKEWSNFNPGIQPGTDRRTELQELHEVYMACPWAWAAVNAIARRVTAGALEFAWHAPDSDGDKEQPDRPNEVVAAERLFRFVNERETIRQLLRGVVVDLLVFGDAYLEVGWRGSIPIALWSLDCPTMAPLADDHGKITGYVQQTSYGQRADFTPHQVIHFSLDAPRSGVFGVSPVRAALGPIERWLFAAATQMQTYRRGDPLRLHVDLPARMSQADIKRWLDMYLSTNVGPDNQAHPIVTQHGGVVKELQRGAITAGLEVMTTARDEILAALGVPPAQAGVIESGNLGGGTGESQDRTFQTQTCDPLASLVLDQLQYRLAERGFGVPEEWRLQFADVDFRDSKTVEDIREMRFKYGALTVNGWRAELGEPPVDGGDEALIVSSTGVPIRVRDLEVAAIAGVAKTTAGTGVKLKSLGGDDAPMELELAPDPPPQPQGGPGGFGGDEDPFGDDPTDDGGGWSTSDDEEEPEEALDVDPLEERVVRSAAGAKRYGLPIGAEITADAIRKAKGKTGGGKPTTPRPGRRGGARAVTPAERARVNAMLDGFRPARIRSDRDATAYLTKNAPKLPAAQRDAVNRYTGDTFLDLNKKLRGGDDTDPEVARLDAAMRPLGEDLILTRHVQPEAFGLTNKTLNSGIEDMRGKVVTDGAYMSTALGSPYGFGIGGVTMRLVVPKGTPAVAASVLSRNPQEREVLLGRGLRVAIAKVERNDRGGWTATAVVLPAGQDEDEGSKAA